MAREFPRSQISKRPFANEIAALQRSFQAPSGGRIRRLAACRGRHGRPPGFVFARATEELPVAQPDHQLACEEGWSYIAEWIGVPLSHVLDVVGIQPQARYVVYFSIDPDWWESIDMADALHPQTFLAYGMNGGELPVGNGGPLRCGFPASSATRA